jgi:hypothetical protein
MNSRVLAIVLLRLMAIEWLSRAVPLLGFVMEIAQENSSASKSSVASGSSPLVAFLVPFLLYVAVAAALWLCAPALSSTMAGPGMEQQPEALTASHLHRIALSLIGIYIFLTGLPSLLHNAGVFFAGIRKGSGPWFVIAYGSQTVLGICLFFGARGLSSWWTRLQDAGLRPRA